MRRAGFLLLLLSFAVCCSSPKAPSYPAGDAIAAKQVRNAVSLAVVCPDGSMFAGSGFAVAPNKVVTAAHVVSCPGGKEPIGVVATIANGKHYVAETLVFRAKTDMALLQLIDAPDFKDPLTVSNVVPKDGDRVFWYSGYWQKLRAGTVKFSTDMKLYVNGDVYHGDSGSGLYNERGEIVAFTDATMEEAHIGVFILAQEWSYAL